MTRIAVKHELGRVICVELEGTGSGNPLAVFATLGNAAPAYGLRVWVEDPAALATGLGRFTIHVPHANTPKEAVAVVGAFLDQLPSAHVAFTIAQQAQLNTRRA